MPHCTGIDHTLPRTGCSSSSGEPPRSIVTFQSGCSQAKAVSLFLPISHAPPPNPYKR